MEWDNILSLVETLAWPVTVLILVLLFRQEVGGLAKRLSTLKYKNVEAKFDKELREAEKAALQVTPHLDSEHLETVDEESERVSLGRLERIAQVSPRAAISEAWMEVEQAAQQLAANAEPPGVVKYSPYALGEFLSNKGIVDDAAASFYNQLRSVRNKAMHTRDFVIESEEAERYFELAMGLVAYLRWRLKK